MYFRRLFSAWKNNINESGWFFYRFHHYCRQKNYCECGKLMAMAGHCLLFLLWHCLMGRQVKCFQIRCFLPCHWHLFLDTKKQSRSRVRHKPATTESPSRMNPTQPPFSSCTTSVTNVTSAGDQLWLTDGKTPGDIRLQHLRHLWAAGKSPTVAVSFSNCRAVPEHELF